MKPLIWWAGAAAALALLAAGEWLAPEATAPAMPAPAAIAAQPAAIATAAQGQAADWSQIMLARPLFRQDRRPLAAAAVADAVVVPLPRLSAIIVTTTGAAAIFADDGGKPLVLRAGGAVAGYTVKHVGPDSVELFSAAGTKILRPQFGPGTGASGDPSDAGTSSAASGDAIVSAAQSPAAASPLPWRRDLDHE